MFPGTTGLSPNLYAFTARNDADQTWDGDTFDVPKELCLLAQRKDDIYPQGKENCAEFLRECQMKGLRFKVKVKKTSPYCTWFYELANAGYCYAGYDPSLSPNLYAFTAHNDADETWSGNPSEAPKELGLLDQRRNDIYPQGRENCAQFLRECQMKGLRFKVKAKKTSPYWTWFYELADAGNGGAGYGPSLSPNLYAFTTRNDADQTWDGNPSDVPKELGMLVQRRNDIYPQGKENCAQFLRECQMKGLRFKIKAKKTSPYWTWFYEVENASGYGAPGYGAPGRTADCREVSCKFFMKKVQLPHVHDVKCREIHCENFMKHGCPHHSFGMPPLM